jgi:hypothetical protein
MGLLFTGNYGFNQSGVPKWQDSTWDLDQLVVPYRGSVEELEAFLSAHSISEASSVDSNMFLIQKPTDEHKQFPTVSLTYQGKRGGVLPPTRHETDRDRLSANSKRSSGNIILAQPLILEYYAPTSIITYYSFGGEGTTEADDPTGDPEFISLTCGDTSFVVSGVIADTVAGFFETQIVKSFRSVEVVPAKYWQNTSKKTKVYNQFLFEVPSGPQISLYSPGVGYLVGDNITITAPGGNGIAHIHVTAVIVLWGDPTTEAGINQWTVTDNNISGSWTGLAGAGGSGTGAAFNIWQIP